MTATLRQRTAPDGRHYLYKVMERTGLVTYPQENGWSRRMVHVLLDRHGTFSRVSVVTGLSETPGGSVVITRDERIDDDDLDTLNALRFDEEASERVLASKPRLAAILDGLGG